MDADGLDSEDDEALEDEWRDRITRHLPAHVRPDAWVVKAFESGTVIAVALTLEGEDGAESDEPVTVAALAKVEGGVFESEDGEQSAPVWFFPGCKEWSLENAAEAEGDAAAYLAGRIARAVK
ncbi:hypothetical protein [Gemmata sp.]|uniref:hypothetical protein n=1 Tax=Gemmata sp. TaxID=1914242 RepID=UPI003F71D69B